MAAKEASSPEIAVETTVETPVLRSVAVEVPARRVGKAFNQTFKALAKTAQVKGFRPGKVPRSVLERVYGPSAGEEIERLLVSETLSDALELAEVVPVTQPDIEAEAPRDGEPFRYTARVEIRPTIELPDFTSLSAEKPDVEVGEDEVQVQLDAMRERSAPLLEEPEQTEAASGHFLTLDFEGRIDDEAFEGGSGKDVQLEIGAGRFIPGFEEQLIGARSGDERSVRVTFPSDYGEESLRDKTAEFSVQVKTLQRRELPALDDEFAKDLGEDSIEALRERVKADLVAAREREAKSALQRTLMDSLIDQTQFEVPPGLVESQLESQMRSLQQRFGGQVPEDLLRQELARMREDGREAAERRTREILLLQAIAEAEEIEAGDEAVDARLAELAEAQGADPKAFAQAAEDQGWRHSISHELRDELVLDFLASKASVAAETEP